MKKHYSLSHKPNNLLSFSPPTKKTLNHIYKLFTGSRETTMQPVKLYND